MKEGTLLRRHTYIFNEQNNGGEQLSLTTEMFSNGDIDGVYWNQTLTLNSYCNSATFNFYGTTIGPEALRDLANQLESAKLEARAKTREGSSKNRDNDPKTT